MEVGIPQSLTALEKSFLPTSRLSLESNVLDVKLASTSQFNDKDDEGEIMLLAMILLQLHGVKLPSPSSSTASEEESDLNKKKRQRTSPDQLAILDQIFQTDKMPNPQTRAQLADQLGMSSRRVQIWFQNKRAKVKRSSMKQDGECSSPSSLGDSSSSITAPTSPSSPSESSDSPSPSPQSPATPQNTSKAVPDTTRTAVNTTVTNATSPSASTSSKSTPSLTVFTSSTSPTTSAITNDTILADTTKQLKAQQQQFSLKAPFVENQPLLAASY